MQRKILQRAVLAAAVSFASIAFGGDFSEPSPLPSTDVGDAMPDLTIGTDGKASYFVQLRDAPSAVVYADTLAQLGVSSQSLAVTRAQSRSAQLRQAQQGVVDKIQKSGVAFDEVYRLQRALNGIAVRLAPVDVARVRAIAGVKSVIAMAPEYPSKSDATAFTGAPKIWTDTLGLGHNYDGTGIRIGIIDTGIDYIHSDFGGTGLLADYQANTTDPTHYFPSAKVVGGIDFAGDGYTGSNAPSPGLSPMDCLGHGTHVAGIAAGFGVNADGSTYSGQYGVNTPFSTLSIDPGTAPKALLYAIRVFGCSGSTNLTPQGIDWSIDPNDDGDFSDHLDVINMSLGSSFGALNSVSAQASENAARVGVVVVASAGNDGDTYYVTGSPGVSTRTLSVAASIDDGQPAPAVHVNAPAGIAGDYIAGTAQFGNPPPPSGLTGNVVIALDPSDASGALTTDGCSPLTNAAAIAGNVALIDRGTCGFVVKAKNAQNAGAIAVIIANSSTGVFGGLAGTDPTVTIPTVMVGFSDGNTFKANIPGLNITLFSGADTLASFSSRGPRGNPGALKPDIAAPGLNITSAQSGHTCTTSGCLTPNASGYIPGNQPLVLSGTSMASPHAAGILALLREEHPTWSVEQLKAESMNFALHDISLFPKESLAFGPSRIGAGRIDAATAAVGQVLAFNADDPGAVSVTFDPQVVISATQTHRVHVVNTGTTAQTFDLAISTLLDTPGVAFSLPGGASLTLPPGGEHDVSVQMHADANQMKHTLDPTMSSTQAAPSPLTSLGNVPRHWLAEEGAYLTLSQGGTTALRVPLYVAPRPASTLAASSLIVTGGAASGTTSLPISGVGVCTGTLTSTPGCTGTFPNDDVSMVSPFELQVSAPARPADVPAFANIQYVGVAYDASINAVEFGISTYGDWASNTDVAVNVCIDTNGDGTYDRVLFDSNPGSMANNLFGVTASPTDSFINGVFNTATSGVSIGNYVNALSAASADTALLRNNVKFLAATPAQLGLSTAAASFKYRVLTCPGFNPLCGGLAANCAATNAYDVASGPYTWNYQSPGVSFGISAPAKELNGTLLPVAWNTANFTANGSLGALLLHHFNASGTRAQAVLLQGSPSADIDVTLATSAATATIGSNVTLTLAATDLGPADATGVAVDLALPDGLTYVSDDAGGAYDPDSGVWSIGALAANASAVIHVVASVDASGTLQATASRGAGAPIDTNASNDRASVSINAPTSADVAVSIATPADSLQVPGNAVTYTIRVSDLGLDPAFAVHVATTYAPGSTPEITAFTASAGSFDSTTGIWSLPQLNPPTSGSTTASAETLQITFTFPNVPADLTVSATATSDSPDPDSANNTATLQLTNDRIFADGFE